MDVFGQGFGFGAVILVVVTFYGFANSAVADSELFPAVESYDGTRRFHFSDSNYYELVDLGFSFQYALKSYRQVYINSNGVLTFGRSIDTWWNYECTGSSTTSRPTIAPFWAYVDQTESAKVLYQSTTSPILLEQASNDIFRAFPREDRNITNLFIVTWKNVSPSKDKGSSQNTFQVAIATDGARSFVLMYFHRLQWPMPIHNNKAYSGFLNYQKGSSHPIAGSCTDDLVNQLTNYSNINVPGKWVFQVGSFSIHLPDLRNEFCNSLDSQSNDWNYISKFFSLLGKGVLIIQDKCIGILWWPSDTVVKCSFGELATVQGTLQNSSLICEVPMLNKLGITDVEVSIDATVYQARQAKRYNFVLSIVKNEDLEETAEFQFSQIMSDGEKFVSVEATWPVGALEMNDTQLGIITKREIAFVLLERLPGITWRETELCTQSLEKSVASVTRHSYSFRSSKLLQIVQQQIHPIFAVQYRATLQNGMAVSKQVVSDVLVAEKLLQMLQTPEMYGYMSSEKCKHTLEEAEATESKTSKRITDPCPITLAQAEADMQFSRQNWDENPLQKPNSIKVFSQIFAQPPKDNTAVCSYNEKGNEIIGAPYGSRLDLLGPYNTNHPWSNYDMDVLLYWYCCQASKSYCMGYFHQRRMPLPSWNNILSPISLVKNHLPMFASVFGLGHVIPFGQSTSFTINGNRGLLWLIKYHNKSKNSTFQMQGKLSQYQQRDSTILESISILDVYNGKVSVVECFLRPHSSDINVKVKVGTDRELQFTAKDFGTTRKSFVYHENLHILTGLTNSLNIIFQSGFALSVMPHQNVNASWISLVAQHPTPSSSSPVLAKGLLFHNKFTLSTNYTVSAGHSIFLTKQDLVEKGNSLVVPSFQEMQLDFQGCDKQTECLFDFRLTRDFAFAQVTREAWKKHQAILDAYDPNSFVGSAIENQTVYWTRQSNDSSWISWVFLLIIFLPLGTIVMGIMLKHVPPLTLCCGGTRNHSNSGATTRDESEYAEITSPIGQNSSVVYTKQQQLPEDSLI